MCEKLYCAPGNAGIADVAECVPLGVLEGEKLVEFARSKLVDFVVIGPDEALAHGLADQVRAANIPCFGPGRLAAEIESSKSFMKDVCARAHVPTAAYRCFKSAHEACAYVREKGAPIVIKADGLTAGKGVTVAKTVDEAISAIEAAMVSKIYGESGAQVVIEEFMEGEEVSFFALSDGVSSKFFTTAQDHKAVFDGDKGPNTGGMGAYSPAPKIDLETEKKIMREIVDPTLAELRAMGRPFSRCSLCRPDDDKVWPKVVEFNARFGDPETQVMIPRLKSDLLALLFATAKGMLDGVELQWHNFAALTVIMATEGYPGAYGRGSVIQGVHEAGQVAGTQIYHAGTKRNGQGQLTANGGRVLCVTATAHALSEAQRQAYEAVDRIDWPQGFVRRDIGWRALTSAA